MTARASARRAVRPGACAAKGTHMSSSSASETPGVDLAILEAWMDDQGLPSGEISSLEELTGGTQNILLKFYNFSFVNLFPQGELKPLLL